MSETLSLKDLETVRTLGTGSFARVSLVTRGTGRTRSVYALKAISKEILFKSKQIQHAKNEKKVLAALTHPFIITLY